MGWSTTGSRAWSTQLISFRNRILGPSAFTTYRSRPPSLPQSNYTVTALFNYHGEESTFLSAIALVAQDIIPPVASEVPEVRRKKFEAEGEGIPIRAWAAGAVVGVFVVAVLLLIPIRYDHVIICPVRSEPVEGRPWQYTAPVTGLGIKT